MVNVPVLSVHHPLSRDQYLSVAEPPLSIIVKLPFPRDAIGRTATRGRG